MKIAALVIGLLLASGGAHAAEFTISSDSFKAGERLSKQQEFEGFGCHGGNLSPALRWRNPPPGTRSFAITAYDPDAPTGSGWWHWVVTDIPSTVNALPEGAGSKGTLSKLPAGAHQGRTDYGSTGFGGACPPVGDQAHRYQFTVHALKTEHLDLPADASAALIGFMIHANTLGSATIEAKYSR